MAHAYMINGRYVDPEYFAETISNLFAAGWTLTPPPEREKPRAWTGEHQGEAALESGDERGTRRV